MNIGIDAHMLGQNETGNETYILELVRSLATRVKNDRLLIYVERPDALPWEARSSPQVRIVEYTARRGASRLLYELTGRASQDRLDVLHMSYNAPLRLPESCALVVTIHDISFEHFPAFFSRRLRTLLKLSVPRSARAAQRVITDTESAKADLVKTYRLHPDKIAVTHYAAGSQFRPVHDATRLAEVKDKYKTGERFVLAVGNLQPRKNWERLIRAFAHAVERAELPHKLVLVGQRLWLDEPILKAAEKLGDRIQLTGYVPAEDLPLLYNAAEVCAYPSLYEGFGLPVLEAMACGTPVITSNVSAMPEIAGDAAILVNPYHEEEVIGALVRVTGDAELRAELKRRGLARAQAFTWERTAEQTMDVYRAAALSKRRVAKTRAGLILMLVILEDHALARVQVGRVAEPGPCE